MRQVAEKLQVVKNHSEFAMRNPKFGVGSNCAILAVEAAALLSFTIIKILTLVSHMSSTRYPMTSVLPFP